MDLRNLEAGCQESKFKSDSDCEIILPMYKIYGTAMFAMLDANLHASFMMGNVEEYIAAGNPIGIVIILWL